MARSPRLPQLTTRRAPRRSGAALIELSLVVSIFFLFLFGILEYSRLVFTRQVIFNAAREGARYAVANITETTALTDTMNFVQTRMCGLDKQPSCNYKCQVYMSDSAGASIGAASEAGFGVYIAVQVDYDYSPIMPNFLFMNQTIHITSRDLMYSEAN